MKKLTQKKKEHFLQKAKEGEILFPKQYDNNLIYVGKGPVNDWFDCPIRSSSGIKMNGDTDTVNYFLYKKDWNDIFKPVTVNVIEIQNLFKEAKQYIGKKVVSTAGNNVGMSFTVKSVYVGFDYSGGSLTKQFLNQNGYFIWLVDNENINMNNMNNITTVLFTPDKNYFNVVEVIYITNNKGEKYQAIDKGSVWEFGCAEIDKELIRDSYNLLKNYKQHKGNRTISKVTIGAADFDLETLEKLVNYK